MGLLKTGRTVRGATCTNPLRARFFGRLLTLLRFSCRVKLAADGVGMKPKALGQDARYFTASPAGSKETLTFLQDLEDASGLDIRLTRTCRFLAPDAGTLLDARLFGFEVPNHGAQNFCDIGNARFQRHEVEHSHNVLKGANG